jgi:FkbM family methyltransferase
LFDGNYLRSLGFNVRTIIDIGVYTGTRPLYDAFDDHRPRRYNFVNKGLGATTGWLTLTKQPAGKNTFLTRTPLTAEPAVAQYDVEVTTLDHLLGSIDFEAPIGIKLDTEGYELEVLKGLGRYRGDVQFVICEASVRRRFETAYQISELMAFMLERGFMFFNFQDLPDQHPKYYDVLFVPKGSKQFS